MSTRIAAISTLILTAAVSAQTSSFVVPPGYANVPGNGLDQQVFGFDQARYAQYIDRAYLVGLPTTAQLAEVRYRREENRLDKVISSYEPMTRNATNVPNWEIKVGNFTGAYNQLNPQYDHASNGVNTTTVFAAQLNYPVNTPTLAAPSNPNSPAPFDMKFPFNVQTVMYTGAGLVVDHKVYASRNVTSIYFVDAIETQATNGGTVDLINASSVGCPLGFNRLYGTAPNPGGGDLQLHLFGAPANSAALAYFGATTTTWSGLSLPLNLGFMGLGACNVYTDLTLPLSAKTDVAGIGSISITVPGSAAFLGATVYNQWAIADTRVNAAMGFALSDGVRIKLGAQLGLDVVRMSVIAAQGGQANANAGYFQPNRGAVLQLLY